MKGQISGKLVASDISDVAIISVTLQENPSEKDDYIISMNKSQELMVFVGCQKLTSAMMYIREYGSTLYVGLARAVSPTNTNFR